MKSEYCLTISPDSIRLEKFLRIVAKMQNHIRSARLFFERFDGEFALAVGFPFDAIALIASHSRENGDAVGRHERGVKTDAELADEFWPIRHVRRFEVFDERLGAALGDGAEVVDDGLPAHADAVVGDGQGAGGFVGGNADLPIAVSFQKILIRQRFEAHLVDRVGGVADQLSQEDFLLGVEGVDDQVEQLLELGLEFHLLGALGGAVSVAGIFRVL